MDIAKNDYEKLMIKFVTSYPLAEVIPTVPQNSLQTADFFFANRSIISELKCLTEDMNGKIVQFLMGIVKKEGIKIKPRNVRLRVGDIIDALPNRESYALQVFEKITSSLESAIEKANRQIRDTRKSFNLPDSLGVLILINWKNASLNPTIAIDALAHLLNKKDAAGRKRYDCIDSIIYSTEKHGCFDPQAQQIPMIFINASEKKDDVVKVFFDEFFEKWAAFRGVNFSGDANGYMTLNEIRNINYYEINKKKQ